MSRDPRIVALACAALVAGGYLLARGGRRRIDMAAMRRKMMERMMNAMPDNSPPKVIATVLPRLQEQNEQILTLLKEQNAILRSGTEKYTTTAEDTSNDRR